MVIVKHLYDVQDFDLKISVIQESLAKIRAKIADDSPLNFAKAKAQHAHDRTSELTRQRKELEHTIADIEERLKTVETRLYGGSVTSPKELTATEEEHGFISEQIRYTEDKLLGVLLDIELAEEEQRRSNDILVNVETKRPAELANLHHSEQIMSKDLVSLNQAREQITPMVPTQILSLYEALRKTKKGRAIATVERGMCQGCRLTSPTSELQRARSSNGVVQCNSCRRILLVI